MDVKTTVLENGLRIMTVERPQTETATLGIWVNTGSACENARNNGVSHFIEHMVFKGTAKRNAQQISEDIENVGGQINAYTSREMTVFYVKMLKEDVELGVDVLAEFVMSPQFPEDEMQKEREVIIQEIRQTKDDPSDIVFDYFQAAGFARQALGMSLLGTEKKVKTYTPVHLHQYMQSNYAAQNMVFAAVGNIKHAQVVKMVAARMANLQAKAAFKKSKQQYTGGSCIKRRNIEQTQLVLGFPGIDYYSPDYYPTAILSSILGGGMSARLYQEIREKRGLVYSIYSFSDSYTKTGLFGIYAGLAPEAVNEYLPLVAQELRKIAFEPVSEIELKRTKAQFKASILSALESTFATAEMIARQTLTYNRILTPAEVVAKINGVSGADIQRVAHQIFSGSLTYTMLGKNVNCPSYDDVIRQFHI